MVTALLAALTTSVCAHAGHSHSHDEEKTWTAAELEELENKWGTDFGFSGINTFGVFKH